LALPLLGIAFYVLGHCANISMLLLALHVVALHVVALHVVALHVVALHVVAVSVRAGCCTLVCPPLVAVPAAHRQPYSLLRLQMVFVRGPYCGRAE
jgi:hypothetical protein